MKRAFSLVELIVVVVIIGILAAIAIPRFSRGAEGAGGAGVKGNLSVLRNAIELYFYEHGKYPGKTDSGETDAGAGTEGSFAAQLTMFTDADGDCNATKDATHIYGPYLRSGVPACPVNPRVGKTGVHILTGATAPSYQAGSADAGWVYNVDSGDLCVNSNATDPDSVSYDTY